MPRAAQVVGPSDPAKSPPAPDFGEAAPAARGSCPAPSLDPFGGDTRIIQPNRRRVPKTLIATGAGRVLDSKVPAPASLAREQTPPTEVHKSLLSRDIKAIFPAGSA